jgi:uroporphyrin-III C-methyltransferase
VVVHDGLVSDEILDLAPAGAQRINVAKRKSRHTLPQDEINQLLVAFALDGLTVVRLKGGDPFLFGRGGEELAACREAGVECHVVPGVTAALAASASGRRAPDPSRLGPGRHLRHRPCGGSWRS